MLSLDAKADIIKPQPPKGKPGVFMRNSIAKAPDLRDWAKIFVDQLVAHFTSLKSAYFHVCDKGSGVITIASLREALGTWSLDIPEKALH